MVAHTRPQETFDARPTKPTASTNVRANTTWTWHSRTQAKVDVCLLRRYPLKPDWLLTALGIVLRVAGLILTRYAFVKALQKRLAVGHGTFRADM